MTKSNTEFERAEQVFLASEGVTAEAQTIKLERVGSTARVLIAGEGEPVLFVGGVMTTGAVFANLVAQMPDYRCIMVDRPGTGLTPHLPMPPTDITSSRRLGDSLLVDVLDGLDIERSHIVCTSLGAWASFRGAAAHPERFLRINALAFVIGARIESMPLSMRMPLIKPLIPRKVPASRRLVLAMLKSAGMRAAIEQGKFSDELADYMVAMLRYTETFRNESLYNARPITPRGPNEEIRHAPELLAKVTAPVHLFWGADDIFAGEESAREFAGLLPNAEVQMVPGAGHAPWLDEPELAIAAVRNHLGG